jgi:flagellar biogenesis protein FliO
MDLLEPLAAVGLVLGLLAAALFVLKKRGVASFHKGEKRLEAIERLSLGPQHALHLVRLDGRSILVATAPTSLQILGEVNQL